MDKDLLDKNVALLNENKDRWLKMPTSAKVKLLDEILHNTLEVAPKIVKKAAELKGLREGTAEMAEEWLAGPMITARNLRLLKKSLEEIAQFGLPRLPEDKVRIRPDGQVIADVFPDNFFDKILFRGFRAEVWMQKEVTREKLRQEMATFYQDPPETGKVALVLGAGNVSSIGPLDVIYKLFVEGTVCLLKLNPVNDYLGPYIEEWFAPLFEVDALRMAYGGADVGAYLCQHDGIDEIHITGSEATHDAIVFGTGEEGRRRKAENRPILNKRITSELGNVSPIIIVPGKWTQKELRFQAENVATQMTNNAGFNCNAAKVLITHKAWAQREDFLQHLKDVLKELPPRKAYYPGAQERYELFVNAHREVDQIGKNEKDALPWTLLPNLNPEEKDTLAFQRESFCAVTGETPLEAADPADFLEKAVSFCNETLHGTLNASIIVHPKTERWLGARLEQAIADLRYGSVSINHWAALSYGLGVTTWGAFPGHTYDNIQSGIGVVHNTLMFAKPEKSVIYGPFVVFPHPPWFATSKNSYRVAPLLTTFEVEPNWPLLMKIVLNSVL